MLCVHFDFGSVALLEITICSLTVKATLVYVMRHLSDWLNRMSIKRFKNGQVSVYFIVLITNLT